MTKDEIKERLPIKVVAEKLGIPLQERQNHTLCICPWHDDHNFGSCFIGKKNIYCRACNESGDIYKVIQTVKGVNFKEALGIAATMLGTNVTYDASGLVYSRMMLTQDEIDFLDLNNQPVYSVVSITNCIDDKKYRYDAINEYDDILDEDIIYAQMEQVCYSPLRNLCFEDENTYKLIVNGKIKEKEQTLIHIQKKLIVLYGEEGYLAVMPLFRQLRELQRKIEVDVTVQLPIYQNDIVSELWS